MLKSPLLALACNILLLTPALADPAPAGALPVGRPAGVRAAQADSLVPIYGGVLVFAGLLFAVIGTTGDPAPDSTAPTSTAP